MLHRADILNTHTFIKKVIAMQISLSKLRYERFIEEQINGGRFASAAEVVEAGRNAIE